MQVYSDYVDPIVVETVFFRSYIIGFVIIV